MDSENCYECFDSYDLNQCFFLQNSQACRDCYFGYELTGCENCLFCVSLENKKYHIFNKVYSKEDYEKLVPKIIEHMSSPQPSPEREGDIEWGEFFPASLSPFGYNETIAQDYFPLSREEIQAKNYNFFERKQEINIPAGVKILKQEENRNDEEILKNVFECKKSKRLFRLIADELKFYHHFHLPLPLLHPDERTKKRISLMPPKELFLHKNKNGNEFISVFNPDEDIEVFENKI